MTEIHLAELFTYARSWTKLVVGHPFDTIKVSDPMSSILPAADKRTTDSVLVDSAPGLRVLRRDS